jgi:hypothetical protein
MYTEFICLCQQYLCVLQSLLCCAQSLLSLLLTAAAARTQATHNETTSAVHTEMLKSGEIFAEATMDHGPARLMIEEQEEAYRQSFVRHVASRTKKVCNDSASHLHTCTDASSLPIPSRLVFCIALDCVAMLMMFSADYV